MSNSDRFQKLNTVTIGLILLLIFVGSFVRSLGAGMGCPDWPTCFGSYVPPISSEQLPNNYLDIFKSQRIEKNKRLVQWLTTFGYDQLAAQIRNNPKIAIEQDFDAVKAWVEYVNRLLGVIVGFFVFLNMIYGISIWKQNKKVAMVGILIFIFVAIQGLIGSFVVSSNLLTGLITIHTLVAFLILSLLIWQFTKCRNFPAIKDKTLFFLSISLLFLFFPQLLLGLQVRSIVDELIFFDTARTSWVSYLTSLFFIHRTYSWLLFILAIVLYYVMFRKGLNILKKEVTLLLIIIICAMLCGLGLVIYDFPFWLQPIHMILATGIFSVLFYLSLRFSPTTSNG